MAPVLAIVGMVARLSIEGLGMNRIFIDEGTYIATLI
jgi:hypothetical protein